MTQYFAKATVVSALCIGLWGCTLPFDPDLRDVSKGFGTSDAARNAAQKPKPDTRGVVSYSNYQVAIARKHDTVNAIAKRLGLNPGELARYNGISPDVVLRAGEVIALPSSPKQIASNGGANSATLPSASVSNGRDIGAIATTALSRVGSSTPISAQSAGKPRHEPVRHRVAKGETIYTISRLYDVSTRSIADWNGLGSQLDLREGQHVLIPPSVSKAPVAAKPASVKEVSKPGGVSNVLTPPSASRPLPAAITTATKAVKSVPKPPKIGQPKAEAVKTNPTSRLARPVDGRIIRDYKTGKNEGIDIAAPVGSAVKAADDGLVAAITKDTNGIAIVVIKHTDNLLTVYTNIDKLKVEKGDRVKRSERIASLRKSDPSFLHFEVRKGLKSVNPSQYLP